MGNTLTLGTPAERLEALNIDVSNYPPWICMWMALGTDLICTPLNCRDSWRDYVPFGLADAGNWFSGDFSTIGVFRFYPPYTTFDEFRSEQGYEPQEGKLLGGVESSSDALKWLKSLYQYMFLTPSTSLANLLTPTALWTLFALIICTKVIKSVLMPRFRKVGINWAVEAHGKEWLHSEANKERIIKFGEYVYRLFYHSLISLWGVYLFWNAPWWNEDQGGTINLWTAAKGAESQPGMIWYYLLQCTYNAEAMIALLEISFQIRFFPGDSVWPITIGWSDTVRSDFSEMFAHHLITNALILLSSFFHEQRIGSMIFFMHDISDVPVDLAKLANFVKWKKATVVAYVLMCAAWFYTRLVVFTSVMWYSTITESIEMVQFQGVPLEYMYLMQPVFVYLMALLIGLHALWFSMFLKMGYVLATKGETHDLTEHKKGEADEGKGVLTDTNGKKKN